MCGIPEQGFDLGSPWAVPGFGGSALRGPIRGREHGSGPGGSPSRVISLSLWLEFPFQYSQRRLPLFFFALAPWGVSWTLRRRRSVDLAEKPGNKRVQRRNWSDFCLQVRVVAP